MNKIIRYGHFNYLLCLISIRYFRYSKRHGSTYIHGSYTYSNKYIESHRFTSSKSDSFRFKRGYLISHRYE